MDYLLVCRSITQAKRAHSCLHAADIPAQIVPTPAFAAPEGCAYSVRFDGQWHDRAFYELDKNNFEPKRVLISDGGRYIRVM